MKHVWVVYWWAPERDSGYDWALFTSEMKARKFASEKPRQCFERREVL